MWTRPKQDPVSGCSVDGLASAKLVPHAETDAGSAPIEPQETETIMYSTDQGPSTSLGDEREASQLSGGDAGKTLTSHTYEPSVEMSALQSSQASSGDSATECTLDVDSGSLAREGVSRHDNPVFSTKELSEADTLASSSPSAAVSTAVFNTAHGCTAFTESVDTDKEYTDSAQITGSTPWYTKSAFVTRGALSALLWLSLFLAGYLMPVDHGSTVEPSAPSSITERLVPSVEEEFSPSKHSLEESLIHGLMMSPTSPCDRSPEIPATGPTVGIYLHGLCIRNYFLRPGAVEALTLNLLLCFGSLTFLGSALSLLSLSRKAQSLMGTTSTAEEAPEEENVEFAGEAPAQEACGALAEAPDETHCESIQLEWLGLKFLTASPSSIEQTHNTEDPATPRQPSAFKGSSHILSTPSTVRRSTRIARKVCIDVAGLAC
eukprot:scaffold647_cov411-Prasinococcus_capsulatus_cf.AAC.18